jgi:hypothetical protein
MNESEIDAAIMNSVSESWSKVAMVIVRTEEALGQIVPDREEGLRVIANRIECLVGSGRLVSQGDLSKWRNSEVRKP